jgi:DNA polymerase-3 subunit epsilon
LEDARAVSLFRGRREPFVHEYERTLVDETLPWRAAQFLSLDFEATGLDLKLDDVISYGAVPISQGRMIVGEQSYSLVRPTKPVPATSSVIHRIRNMDLEGAPDAWAAAAELVRQLSGRALVAHASWVEVAYLKRLLALQNTKLLVPVIDTASLARALGLRPRISDHEPHLESLAASLGLPVHDPHHALGDALTTAQIFLVLVSRLEREHGPMTVGDLQNLSRQYGLLRP